jgi:hemerythrin-like domain-containing protein
VDPLEILRQEHRLALRVVGSAREMAADSAAGGRLDTARLGEVLDFLRYFANACHGPKEEDLLFTALHRHGLQWDRPPLRDLMRQHEELRVALDSATDWFSLADEGVPGAVGPLLHDLLVALDVLERNIALEEHTLFPLAGERLHQRDLDDLACSIAAIVCDEEDEGVHAYYAGVARELAGA